jgi:transposase
LTRVDAILQRVTPVIADLPDLTSLDSNALKALLIEKHTLIIEQRAAIEQQRAALDERHQEIETLKLYILKLKRMKFGRSSEKLDQQIEQLELRLEDLETAEAAKQSSEASSRPSSVPAARRRPSRKPLPAHLPRETQTHQPAQTACPKCGGQLDTFGEDVSEILELVPASFKVIRIVRPKCRCASCNQFLQEPAPHRPIDRGLAGPALLAHVIVSKYSDHLPLYRQSEIYGAKAWNWNAQLWRNGSAAQPRRWNLWSMPTALRAECIEAARRRHSDSGAGAWQWQNSNSTVMDLRARRSAAGSADARQCGLPIRRTANPSIRLNISPAFAAHCRPMAMRASTDSTITARS